MRIIFSPTKTMQQDNAAPESRGLPAFLHETERLLSCMKSLSAAELKNLWDCSDKIVEENVKRFETMDLKASLCPAAWAFEGIAFKYLDIKSLNQESLDYLQDQLRILSGFYGVLKAFDGVQSYRLDMENKISLPGYKNLYDFWGDKLYRAVRDESGVIINLASGEYAKCIEKYLGAEDRFISCSFVENVNGQLKQKATFSKMARGEILRFMAENKIQNPEELKEFKRLDFKFRDDLSCGNEFVFEHLI